MVSDYKLIEAVEKTSYTGEKQIDKIVYKPYELTTEEIEIVENKPK